MGDDAFQ